MERMWLYLRRFGRMTKEMRPSHWVDVLTHALVYYGRKKKEKLGIYVHHNLRLIISAYFNMGNCLCSGSFGTEMEEGQDD